MFLNSSKIHEIEKLIGVDGYLEEQGHKRRCKLEEIHINNKGVRLILRDRAGNRLKRHQFKFTPDED